MTFPKNSADSETFVVLISKGASENSTRETFVFNSSTSLKDVFGSIFSEARTDFFIALPSHIEIFPNLSSLPKEKSVHDMLMEKVTREDVSF